MSDREKELAHGLWKIYATAIKEGRSPIPDWYRAGYLKAAHLKGVDVMYALSQVPTEALLKEALDRGMFADPEAEDD